MSGLVIPHKLLPGDGRFGSGPSKVRPEAVRALEAAAPGYLGTSHRQGRVRDVVAGCAPASAELFGLPEGYEVVLGNGGTTAFWDAAAFCLVERPEPAPVLRGVLGQVRRLHAGGAIPGRAPGARLRARDLPAACRRRRPWTPTA